MQSTLFLGVQWQKSRSTEATKGQKGEDMRSSLSNRAERANRGSISIQTVGIILVAGVIALLIFIAFFTASGRRAIVDFKSDIGGGLNRTIRVYTANGDLLAEYNGKIDLEATQGGYVKFDFEGKRYTYYNCFVESIADIN